MRPRLLLTINCKFAVDFFARGLHTRIAVARLPLRQLGFLVLTALECTKFVFGRGFAPDPAGGAYSAPPDPLGGLRRPTSKGRGEKGVEDGREGKGRNIQNDCHQWLSHSFRVHRIRFRPGLRPSRAGGAYSAPPDHLAGLKGTYFRHQSMRSSHHVVICTFGHVS